MSVPTPGDRELERPARDVLVQRERRAAEQVARAQAGVQLREGARSLPVEVVGELGVDDRAQQEREVAVLRVTRARGARHSASPVQPPIAPSRPMTAASRVATSSRPAGRAMNAPGERIALGFANEKLLATVEQPHRGRLEHRRPQQHVVQPVLGVLARRRAAREEGLQRLRGELHDCVAFDPARPAALELLTGRGEHAQPHLRALCARSRRRRRVWHGAAAPRPRSPRSEHRRASWPGRGRA